MPPAIAKVSPTESIVFGDIDELRHRANRRVTELHSAGLKDAYLYGADAESQPGTQGLNAFFLLVDKPQVYNLPPDPVVPTKNAKESWSCLTLDGIAMAIATVVCVTAGGQK